MCAPSRPAVHMAESMKDELINNQKFKLRQNTPKWLINPMR
jgi:hypothetical protein